MTVNGGDALGRRKFPIMALLDGCFIAFRLWNQEHAMSVCCASLKAIVSIRRTGATPKGVV